jgi:hypothetical protein
MVVVLLALERDVAFCFVSNLDPQSDLSRFSRPYAKVRGTVRLRFRAGRISSPYVAHPLSFAQRIVTARPCRDNADWQVPNPKSQIPNPNLRKTSEWLGWDLDLGIWDLGFVYATQVDH